MLVMNTKKLYQRNMLYNEQKYITLMSEQINWHLFRAGERRPTAK